MELSALVLLPFLGGILALIAGRFLPSAARLVALAALLCGLAVLALVFHDAGPGRWMAVEQRDWAPALGMQVLLAMDGLSFILVALSMALGVLTVALSWGKTDRAPLLHATLCWTVAATNGVFLAFDLMLFVFFWEMMLIPSFLLIAIWGHEKREAAAMKFLIFNAIAGLGLLAAVFWIGATGPEMSFNAFEVAERQIPLAAQIWLLLGFSGAFLVKLPVPPFHAWLPDAHTEAPTVGSILLAGLLLKTGAYGMFRFPAMLFPEAVAVLAPWGLALGAFGTIYAALIACGQTDAKRLVAYTSVAHMSVVLMGIAGGVHFSLMGAGIVMVAHAFSASALFLLIGAIDDRVHTRDLRELGGLQRTAPRFAAAFALFFSATLAMPGTANFLGEALVITGLFQVNWAYASITLVSLVISVVYATRLFQRVVFGSPHKHPVNDDLGFRELAPVIALALGTLVFGLLPQALMLGLDVPVNAAVGHLQTVAP